MNLKAKTYKLEPNTGFTLIEIMVAVSIFAIVAVITTGALVTANNTNRKAQAIKLAIDNLNFAVDSMVLNLGNGGRYHCITGGNANPNWPTSYDETNPCPRSEEHTSELQSQSNLVCRLLLEKK